MERRAAAEFQHKARRLEGYAAVFGVETRIGAIREVVAPGAFRASLDNTSRDVVALWDHNPGVLLARQRSGSLRLSEDSRGLSFSLDLPDTQAGRDVRALAERGDLGGMSFGFQLPPEGMTREGDLCILRAVDLLEISVVSSWPAYPTTVVEARDQHRAGCAVQRSRAVTLMKLRWPA